jgi:hypothetical protein
VLSILENDKSEDQNAHKFINSFRSNSLKKVATILSLVILFAVMSVQAQQQPRVKPTPQLKPVEPAPQPAPFDQAQEAPSNKAQEAAFDNLITVEDEATGSFIIFSPLAGEYKFFRCSDGTAMSGVGKVKIDGCSIYLEDVQPSHRVLISVNQCDQEGKAAIERFAVKDSSFAVVEIKAFLTDHNMRDNTQSCVPTK